MLHHIQKTGPAASWLVHACSGGPAATPPRVRQPLVRLAHPLAALSGSGAGAGRKLHLFVEWLPPQRASASRRSAEALRGSGDWGESGWALVWVGQGVARGWSLQGGPALAPAGTQTLPALLPMCPPCRHAPPPRPHPIRHQPGGAGGQGGGGRGAASGAGAAGAAGAPPLRLDVRSRGWRLGLRQAGWWWAAALGCRLRGERLCRGLPLRSIGGWDPATGASRAPARLPSRSTKIEVIPSPVIDQQNDC